jgi:hypothetical protein
MGDSREAETATAEAKRAKENHRFISTKVPDATQVVEKTKNSPLFLDSPPAAPYLVVVAQPDHKIGYPAICGPRPETE